MTTPSPWEPQPVQPIEPVLPVHIRGALDEVRNWLERYITVVVDSDLDVLALWAAHTHLVHETYSTPRLIIDSPVPGSGKTTVLDHFSRLCFDPIQAASLSSPAMLARLIDTGIKTILIDEADRTLDPKLEKTGELIAVLNSGYRRGQTRPVLVPDKGGTWAVKEMPTFSPVVMAGNAPNLPDDTKSRSIRVMLMPDIDGTAEESDWEYIEDDAADLRLSLTSWCDHVRDEVRTYRPVLPDGVRGRLKECWGPLKRIAVAAGGRWPEVVDQLAAADLVRISREKEEGIVVQKPHITLLSNLHELWPEGSRFMPTEQILKTLAHRWPESWGTESRYGKSLTAQRFGRLLVTHFNVTSDRLEATGPRGYTRASLEPAFRSLGIAPPDKPAEPAEPAEPAHERLPSRCCMWCGNVMTLPGDMHPLCQDEAAAS